MPRAKLNHAQRVYVVQRLAAFDTPSTIARALREQFGVSIAPQSLSHYDPTLVRGRPQPHLKELFETTRARAMVEQTEAGAVAARLEALELQVKGAISTGDAALAARLREMIGREIGARVVGKPSTECEPTPEPQPALSDDERARALAALIDRLNAEAEWSDNDKTPR